MSGELDDILAAAGTRSSSLPASSHGAALSAQLCATIETHGKDRHVARYRLANDP